MEVRIDSREMESLLYDYFGGKDKDKQFSSNMRFLRKQNKMTQRELGEVLGYGYTTISNYENGRNEPSIYDLKKIANYFEVTIDYLVGNTSKINSEQSYEYTKELESIRETLNELSNKINNLVALEKSHCNQ